MKTPTSDPSGQHADELKAQIDAAIEKEDIDEVVNLSIHATWVTAVAICQEAGIPAPRLVGLSQLGRFLAFRDACDAHLEKATDHRITFAREAFEAIAMVTSGIWKDYGEALLSIHNTGSYRRGFVPKWESAFLPVAIEYCSGKAKVPLADLRRHAEKWAASEVASGRNPEFPGTEKGVLDGLKRMESSGRLIIPGRREGT